MIETTDEGQRLEDARERGVPWRKWGPLANTIR